LFKYSKYLNTLQRCKRRMFATCCYSKRPAYSVGRYITQQIRLTQLLVCDAYGVRHISQQPSIGSIFLWF